MKSKQAKKVSTTSAKAPQARAAFIALPTATGGPSDGEIVAAARIVDEDDPFASLAIRSIARTLHLMRKSDSTQVVQWPDGTTAIVVGDLSKARDRSRLLLEGYSSAREHPLNRLNEVMHELDLESMAMR